MGGLVVALLCATSLAPGEGTMPFSLFGSLSNGERPQADADPNFPVGARRGPSRPDVGSALCSSRRPVCVHAKEVPLAERTLAELEEAYDRLVLALRLPPPLPDSNPTGPALDLYLSDDARELEVGTESTLFSRDVAPAYCVVGAQALSPSDPVRCVAEASSMRLDAAETPAIRRALSTYMSWIAFGPDHESLEAVAHAQAHPEAALFARERDSFSSAGALLFAHLELAYGSGRSGEGALALFTQSRSDHASDGMEWNNEPDVLDVLRALTGQDETRFADLAIDFAIARLFLGDRADGIHVPGFPWLGESGQVRFDWSVPFSTLPRNLAGARPLEPLGSAYVWLDMRDAPANAPLAASFAFEAPVRFRFSIVAIGERGNELSRFDVPFFPGGSQIERTLRKPVGAVGLVFVAVNLGAVDVDYPFDPDHGPWEPHSYELYLTAL
jgi:hypothetical protein